MEGREGGAFIPQSADLSFLNDREKQNAIAQEFAYMRTFVTGKSPYTERDIEGDISRVVDKERYFLRKNAEDKVNRFGEKGGDPLEKIITEYAYDNEWFDLCSIKKTLRYDDYFNKVDFVLEFPLEVESESSPSRIALMVDCTQKSDLGSQNSRLEDKVRSNIIRVSTSNTWVKYFESDQFEEDNGEMSCYKGGIYCVPVVIGIDRQHVEDFWASDKSGLDRSPIQIAFLEEIRMQLQKYISVLSGDEMRDVSERIERIKTVERKISEILLAKDDLANDTRVRQYISNDGVYEGIGILTDH